MPTPKDCQSITEIRNEIDRIDKLIIELLGERFQYVKEIVNFKSNADDVVAKSRYHEVFEIRRQWAAEQGISPLVVEQVYKILVHYFIDEQMRILKERNSQD
jgi:isochorismate pyruvate lyase